MSNSEFDNEFPLLHAIATLHLVVGGLLVVAGLIWIVVTAQSSWDIPEAWIKSIGTLGLGIATYTWGEMIQLFLQIEKNTRQKP